ncbi:hypothetical protein U1Q18_020521 [Sarracenia purpurea var. burkii]
MSLNTMKLRFLFLVFLLSMVLLLNHPTIAVRAIRPNVVQGQGVPSDQVSNRRLSVLPPPVDNYTRGCNPITRCRGESPGSQ